MGLWVSVSISEKLLLETVSTTVVHSPFWLWRQSFSIPYRKHTSVREIAGQEERDEGTRSNG